MPTHTQRDEWSGQKPQEWREEVNVERIDNNLSLFHDDLTIKKLASTLKTRD